MSAATPNVYANIPQFLSISNAASGDTDLIAGTSGYSIVVASLTLVPPNSTAVTITFKSGTAGAAITGAMPIGGASNPPMLQATCDRGLFVVAAGDALTMNLSGANLVAGFLTYWLERSV